MKLYEYIFKNQKENLLNQFNYFKEKTKSRFKEKMIINEYKIAFDTIDDLKDYLGCEVLEVAISEKDTIMLISNHNKVELSEKEQNQISYIISNCK